MIEIVLKALMALSPYQFEQSVSHAFTPRIYGDRYIANRAEPETLRRTSTRTMAMYSYQVYSVDRTCVLHLCWDHYHYS